MSSSAWRARGTESASCRRQRRSKECASCVGGIDENRKLQTRRHAANAAALRELSEKLDRHAATVAAIRPAVAALEVSRSKLATWASIGFAAVVVLGWIVEGAVKWAVGWALSHFQ
jgi:hypothetical protein